MDTDLKNNEEIFKEECIRRMCYKDDIFLKVAVEVDDRVAIEIIKEYVRVKYEDVEFIKVSNSIDRINDRSVIGDILVGLKDGSPIALEMQRDLRGATEDRAMHILSMLLVRSQEKGSKYIEIPSITVLFLVDGKTASMENEVTFYNMKSPSGRPMANGKWGIGFVNCKYMDDNPIGRMNRDLSQSDPYKIENDILREVMIKIKLGEEQRNMKNMSERLIKYGEKKGFQDGKVEGFQDGKEQGFQDGKAEEARNFAIRLFDRNYDSHDIADLLELSVEEVERLREDYSSSRL